MRSVSPSSCRIALFCLAAMSLSTNALAQTTGASAADGADQSAALEEVVVFGERALNRAAIWRKFETTAIYDSINVDDIGKLPDFNVPDAFRRVPGVMAIFDEDEGRFVTARGLPPSYNYTTIDGIAVATIGGFGDGTRDVNLEAIPSTAVDRLEIFKTFTPDIDLAAVGGYFNLVTRSAMRRSDPLLVVDGNLSYYTFDDVPQDNAFSGGKDSQLGGRLGTRIEATYATQFGASDQFGVVASGSYLLKTRDEEKVIPDNYRYVGPDDDGNGIGDYAVPERYRWYVYTNRAERYGADVKLEWFPSSSTSWALNNYIYVSREDETRSGHQIRGIEAADITPTSPTSGTVADAFGELAFVHFPLDYDYTGHILTSAHEFDSGATLEMRAGYTTAQIDDDFPEFFLRTPLNSPDLGGTYDLSGRVPFYSPNDPDFWNDPNNYSVNFHRHRYRYAKEELANVRVDFSHNIDGADTGWGYKAGLEHRDQDRVRDVDMTYYVNNYVPGEVLAPNDSGYTPPGRDVPYQFVDYARFRELADFTVDEVLTAENSLSNDFRYEESIRAGYAMGSYTQDRWRVVGGLRYEDVDVTARNFVRVAQAGIDDFTPVVREGDYDNLMPSFVGTYSVSDSLRLKGAYSQTLSRPNPDQVSRTATASLDGLTISQGNPDLVPRESNNVDLGLEYYFDDLDGLFSVGLFRKDISREIVTRTSAFTNDLGETVTVTQPVNVEGAEVRGVEMAYINNSLDSLPKPFSNLGFSLSATHVDAELMLDSTAEPPESRVEYLLSQPEWFGNATLFYTWRERLQLRLAYNYLSKFHTNVTTDPVNQAGDDGMDTLDFSVRYDLNDRLTFKFDARNVTDENQKLLRGPGLAQLREDVEFGRVFFFGMSYSN